MPAAAPAAGTPIGDWITTVQNSQYTAAAAPTYARADVAPLAENQAQVTVTLDNVGGTTEVAATSTIVFFYTADATGLAMTCNPAATGTTVEAKYLPGACRD